MIGSKPLASLSSTLLARKGTARPAMRPQGFVGLSAMPGPDATAQDDLGWNDMGYPEPALAADPTPPADATVPPVLHQRAALQEELTAPMARLSIVDPSIAKGARATAPKSVSVATATRIGRETRAKHVANARSAFTLRLDTDRHLKLRLASALQNRSAQLLVTEALDAFLETMPEVDTLLSQLPARAKD